MKKDLLYFFIFVQNILANMGAYMLNEKRFFNLSRIAHFAALLIVFECETTCLHIDFPGNHFEFTGEGGIGTFSYRDYTFIDSIMIDGLLCESKPIYHEGTYIGIEVDGWLRIIDYDYSGNRTNEKLIEVMPNTSGKDRSAEIPLYVIGSTDYSGEIYVHQAAQRFHSFLIGKGAQVHTPGRLRPQDRG